MRQAWLAASVISAALITSGCVVVVADDGAKMHYGEFSDGGHTVLDRDGDYSRIGGDMDLSGWVGGDVSLISGDVNMEDIVIGGELSIAAGDVDFSGRVEQDASIAGGDVTWIGHAGQDLSIASGDLLVRGTIEGEGAFAAGDMYLDGDFLGDLNAQADDMFLQGRVGGALRLVAADEIRRNRRDDEDHGRIELAAHLENGGEICSRSLIIGPEARIDGALHVWAEQEPVIASGALIQDLRFEYRDGRECDDILD